MLIDAGVEDVAGDSDHTLAHAKPLDLASLTRASPVLVVVPHPDDEPLGCGGLLALLGDAGAEIHVLLVNDGAASHPGSQRFDASARRALRDAEWRLALARLGLSQAARHRLCCHDGDVPRPSDPGFGSAHAETCRLLDTVRPALVVLPWRRDPHPDHRGSHDLIRGALRDREQHPRCLEYLVWTLERGRPDDRPAPSEARVWRLDISRALDRKRAAIAAHRSQLGEVILDDPGGFVIAPAMRRRAEGPLEYYVESEVRA